MRFDSLLACVLWLAGAGIVSGTTLRDDCASDCVDYTFGFIASPRPVTGEFVVDLLVPNNQDPNPAEVYYSVTGALSGSATLFQATAWTGGQLDSYLGISAKPANPIGAFLPSTELLDAGATGFYVYQVDLGKATLAGASQPDDASQLETIGPSITRGSWVIAFLNTGTKSSPSWSATASGGAMFVRGSPAIPGDTPEPASFWTIAASLIVVLLLCRRQGHWRFTLQPVVVTMPARSLGATHRRSTQDFILRVQAEGLLHKDSTGLWSRRFRLQRKWPISRRRISSCGRLHLLAVGQGGYNLPQDTILPHVIAPRGECHP